MATGSSRKQPNKAIQLSLFSPAEPAEPKAELTPPPPPPPAPVAAPEPPEGIKKEIIELRKKELIAKFKKQTEEARAARKNLDKRT